MIAQTKPEPECCEPSMLASFTVTISEGVCDCGYNCVSPEQLVEEIKRILTQGVAEFEAESGI